MIDRWDKRFENIRFLGWLALAGLPFCVVAVFTSDFVRIFYTVAACLLILPAFVYIYVIVIWHWKDRYRGKHSDLWGALILLETSGWMKIVYLFRHILPDMYHRDRYRFEPSQPV
jgi:fucose permease